MVGKDSTADVQFFPDPFLNANMLTSDAVLEPLPVQTMLHQAIGLTNVGSTKVTLDLKTDAVLFVSSWGLTTFLKASQVLKVLSLVLTVYLLPMYLLTLWLKSQPFSRCGLVMLKPTSGDPS